MPAALDRADGPAQAVAPGSAAQSAQSNPPVLAAFGPLTIAFESSEPEWLEHAAIRFRMAPASGPADFTLRHESNGEPLPSTIDMPRRAYNENTRLEAEDNGFSLFGHTFHGYADFTTATASVRGPAGLYPADHLLRQILPVIYPDGGLLFHGAVIQSGRHAWLAAGESGAGKSTLAKLAGQQALADETGGLRRIQGQWWAESLPYAAHRPGRAPLAGILVLDKGRRSRNHMQRLGQADAARSLVPHLWWPLASAGHRVQALDRLSQLVDEVPVFELSFRREPAVLAMLEEATV